MQFNNRLVRSLSNICVKYFLKGKFSYRKLQKYLSAICEHCAREKGKEGAGKERDEDRARD